MSSSKPLNPWPIARVLGGRMVSGRRLGFGGFGVLPNTCELLASRPERLPNIDFSDSDDEVIRKSFEKIRDGVSVDRLLADPKLTKRFNALCKQLGVRHPAAEVNRRLLRMRKSPGGGQLNPTSVIERHPGLAERLGLAVEPAMVKMLLRHGASVDDLLADPALGAEFEEIARTTIDDGSPVEYRLCALQIRKSRHLPKSDATLFEQLDSGLILDDLVDLGSVAAPEDIDLPDGEGLAILAEPNRPLLVRKFRNLTSGVDRLSDPRFVKSLGAGSVLWNPNPDEIHIRAIAGDELSEAPLALWELRVINDWNPVFNWPLHAA